LSLRALIARQRPGYALEQPFYTSEQIFTVEQRTWLARQWFLVAHSSEVSEDGSFIVRGLLGESLLIVRDKGGTLRGFYNVCRHRGSRICDRDGRSTSLVCPYHAWSYSLDGSLRAAQSLPDGVEKSALALRTVSLAEVGGLILVSLTGEPGTLESIRRELEPGLSFHGIPEARIAARRSYPTRGNWKLVLENFIECYHCFPAHAEYCRVMKHVDAVARDSPAAADTWHKRVETWRDEQAARNSPLAISSVTLKLATCSAGRAPIGGGYQTQSEDGRPVAPLMGGLSEFDGGVSTFRCEPFLFLTALNDHAVMFQFSPISAEHTDVTICWLVNRTAREDQVDVERMTWLWDITTTQDKALIERNAAGVCSRSYRPGPYSKLESLPARFVSRYLQELSSLVEASHERQLVV
jgi:Rieske 2Fe-2S family protein